MTDDVQAQVDAVLDVLAPAPAAGPPGVRVPIVLLHRDGRVWPEPPGPAELDGLARQIVAAVRAADGRATAHLPKEIEPADGDEPGRPWRLRRADGSQRDYTSAAVAELGYNHADGPAALYRRQEPAGVWVRTQAKADPQTGETRER